MMLQPEKLGADVSAGFGLEAVNQMQPGQGLLNAVIIFALRIGYELWSERRKRKRERNASVTKSPPEGTS